MKTYNVKVNGNDYIVAIDSVNEETAIVSVNSTKYKVELETSILSPKTPIITKQAQSVAPATTPVASRPSTGNGVGMKSPLPGTILEVCVREGDTVTVGQKLMVLEAMKMENNIEAENAGVVKRIAVSNGSAVMEGDLLITIE